MLTNKQVNRLHEERNGIIRFTQELREMACNKDAGWTFATYLTIAASQLEEACYMIDKGILEGSASEDRG